MVKHDELTAKDFDAMLALFSPDREEAGEKYEQMRQGLERYFHFKGCADPRFLADETINRVAAKIETFDPLRNVRPASYFYGFASNVLMEYRRNASRELSLSENQCAAGIPVTEDGTGEAESKCLRKCLEKLSAPEKEMIVDYYRCAGRQRNELRRQICERIECTAAALYTKIFRIKRTLRDCIENCLKITV